MMLSKLVQNRNTVLLPMEKNIFFEKENSNQAKYCKNAKASKEPRC